MPSVPQTLASKRTWVEARQMSPVSRIQERWWKVGGGGGGGGRGGGYGGGGGGGGWCRGDRGAAGWGWAVDGGYVNAFLAAAALTRVMRAAVPIPDVAPVSVLHSAAVGGSVVGDVGPL